MTNFDHGSRFGDIFGDFYNDDDSITEAGKQAMAEPEPAKEFVQMESGFDDIDVPEYVEVKPVSAIIEASFEDGATVTAEGYSLRFTIDNETVRVYICGDAEFVGDNEVEVCVLGVTEVSFEGGKFGERGVVYKANLKVSDINRAANYLI